MYEHRSHMKMTADLPKVLQALKDKGFILGLSRRMISHQQNYFKTI